MAKINDMIEIVGKKFKLKNKMACFDLDNTLIQTKSGKTFPVDIEMDWKFNKNVKEKLKEYYENNFCIIIISNQKGLKTKQQITMWRNKLIEIEKQLGIPIMVYGSIDMNIYRKPNIGIWDILKKSNVDMTESFYCGDAMGRDSDFSDTDIKFAINCGLRFIAPETIFLNMTIKLPTKFDYFDFNNFEKKPNNITYTKDKDLIIFVGYPGSGKSTFINNYLVKNNYSYISLDELKTQAKCIILLKKYMTENLKIAIDMTNPTRETRMKYIEIANTYDYNVRCFKMTTTFYHALHNNMYRYLYMNSKFVPMIAYHIYNKKYEEPDMSEGYYEIKDINPEIPDKTNYYLYLF